MANTDLLLAMEPGTAPGVGTVSGRRRKVPGLHTVELTSQGDDTGALGGLHEDVYLAAVMLDTGESLLGAAGGSPQPWWESTPDGLAWRPRSPERVFYNDCPTTDTASAVSRLQPQSASSFTDAVEGAAWRDRPSTYVICERDQAIPPFAQEAMAKRATDTVRLDSDHSPFLSQPGELVVLLTRFA